MLVLRGTLACLLALGCGDGAETADGGGEPSPEPWQLVIEGHEAAFNSVAGTGPDDVWVAGADSRDGKGALLLHYDGERFTRVDLGLAVDLWWVHVLAEDRVFIGGAEGTVLRYDGESFEPLATPGTATVYGVWGTAEDDLWAVGGEPSEGLGFVWRYDGSSWSDASAQIPADTGNPALFKVWGRAEDDVWIVGVDGTTLHWDGTELSRGDSGTDQQLFTVHGPGSGSPPFVAVGGYGTGVIREHDGTTWHDATPMPEPMALFGVHMDRSGHGFAVGSEGYVLERSDGVWNLLDTGHELFDPFHSVWVDSAGGVWAAGGDVMSATPSEGVLLHRGDELNDEIVEE